MSGLYQFDDVTFGYGETALFSGLGFTMREGAFILVSGPSGAGKSTLLRLMCRLEEPRSGVIRYRERPLMDIEPPLLRREVNYLQQTPALAAGDVRQNLLLPFGFTANSDLSPPDDEELRRLLDEFLLRGVELDDDAAGLSVGQKQRLCLIRSLLLRPKALLLDEPVSALDPESRELVESKAEALNVEQGVTVVMISHQSFEPRLARPERLEVRDGRAAYLE